ncbi:MAG: 5'-methylthioadenosine phosphorylase [uncultured Nocardioidaceae bacterium]|uniref:Purine nucleoside phosphorylase n=1 Tax=uncultured Nocardioidaceae bacterium TaxID=253824 RepID=A0A6J4LKF3_9ACTN|nr:MAG: 5'-methylthioadenosine phosphorylase [uncultured Nocardioidaceae bacterium]
MTPPAPPSPDESRPVGLIGGSGLYSFVPDAEQVTVETPYGAPSAPVGVGTVGGRRVAFLPRHGTAHEHPPHALNYRANLWALASLGVRQVVAACAVGGLRPATPPGTFVVPDQLVDRTSGRVQTYVERGAVHVPFADPYCPELRTALLHPDPGTVDGGTMVVIEGPRFSTRAESRWYAAQGWTLVGMTGHPEAVLARELGLCYATIALVTDLDAGLTETEAVDQATVLAVFAANTDRLRGHLATALGSVTGPTACRCRSWQDDVTLTFDLP